MEPSGQAPRVALPGELYQRADRWWWRVKLPGEERARARPLKLNGAKEAASDRQTAEQIALEMWEHAVGEYAAHQIRMESHEKIERLKAQFLDKVRHFTELVETAHARLETEVRARAEAEAKLRQMAKERGEASGSRDAPDTRLREGEAVSSPAAADQVNDQSRMVDCGLRIAPEGFPQSEIRNPQAASREISPPPAPGASSLPCHVGVCECCGAASVPLANLKRIDSGQLLCPDCLVALRADATRCWPGKGE